MLAKYLTLAGALAGALVWTAAAQAAPGETTGNTVLRSGPGTAYAVIGRIPAGAQVNILTCGRWCELGYAGRDGYVSPNSVVAEYPAAPYVTDSYPIIDNFYDDNPPYPSFQFRGHDHYGDHGWHGHGGMGMGGGRGGMGSGHDGGHGHDRH